MADFTQTFRDVRGRFAPRGRGVFVSERFRVVPAEVVYYEELSPDFGTQPIPEGPFTQSFEGDIDEPIIEDSRTREFERRYLTLTWRWGCGGQRKRGGTQGSKYCNGYEHRLSYWARAGKSNPDTELAMFEESIRMNMSIQGRARNGGGLPGGSVENMIRNWQAVQTGGVEDSRTGIDRIEFANAEWRYYKDGSIAESGTMQNRLPYE